MYVQFDLLMKILAAAGRQFVSLLGTNKSFLSVKPLLVLLLAAGWASVPLHHQNQDHWQHLHGSIRRYPRCQRLLLHEGDFCGLCCAQCQKRVFDDFLLFHFSQAFFFFVCVCHHPDVLFWQRHEQSDKERWQHLADLADFALAMKVTLMNINYQSFNNFMLRIGTC